MNKKEIILLSALLNIGLLTLLLMTAIHQESANPLTQPESTTFKEIEVHTPPPVFETVQTVEIPDELDEVLQSYAQRASAAEQKEDSQEETVQVTVKWGDALEKIARANGTTIAVLKKLNQLEGDRLQIGQVLLVPKSAAARASASAREAPAQPTVQTAAQTSGQTTQDEAGSIYYQVQKGDNPWTIARRFHVSYTEILRLNELDEESARNMRPGDRVRVK